MECRFSVARNGLATNDGRTNCGAIDCDYVRGIMNIGTRRHIVEVRRSAGHDDDRSTKTVYQEVYASLPHTRREKWSLPKSLRRAINNCANVRTIRNDKTNCRRGVQRASRR